MNDWMNLSSKKDFFALGSYVELSHSMLLRSFGADPISRLFFPSLAMYRKGMSGELCTCIGKALLHGEVWISPDVSCVSVFTSLKSSDLVREPSRGEGAEAEWEGELRAWRETLQKKVSARFYLEYIATDVRFRGLGIGARMLTHVFSVSKLGQSPIYLEASSSKSKSFFESLGFTEVDFLKLPRGRINTAMVRSGAKEK